VEEPGPDVSLLAAVADTALAAWDLGGRVVSVTDAIEGITGIPAGDHVGLDVAAHVHPDDRHTMSRLHAELVGVPDGSRRTARVRMARPGGWVGVEVTATRRRGLPGAAVVVASVRAATDDVDPQLRAAVEAVAQDRLDDLERRQRFLRSVVEASADAVVVIGEDLRVRWASESSEATSGWPVMELVAMSVTDLAHPDDLEEVLGALSDLLGEGPDRPPLLCRVRTARHEYRWMRVTASDMRHVPWIDGIVAVLTDVSEAVQARAELASSERRFEALVANAHDCIIVSDADGTATYCSPAMRRVLGWDPELVVGVPFASGLHHEARAELRRALEAAIADPSTTQIVTTRMPHADGTQHWVEAAIRSRLDDPEVAGVVANLHDVDEHYRLLEELEEHNRILHSLAFSSTTGLFEEDSRRGTTFVNERFCEITGLGVDDVLGSGWRHLLEITDRDDGTRSLTAVPPGPEPVSRARIRRPDGEARWIDIRSSVLPGDTRGIVRRLGGIEDVTAVVESEEALGRLADAVDTTGDLVLLVDSGGKVIYSNEAGQRFFGERIADLDSVPGMDALIEGIETDVILGGANRWEGEVTLANARDVAVPMSLKAVAHRDDDGEIAFYSAIAHDISERIALEGILERQATHDPLTGLPNRQLLFERIRRAGEAAGPNTPSTALLFIDLDHFKVINDSLGHALGDVLLQAIAKRIATVRRPGDTVARFGGDEFVVLCEPMAGSDDALQVARRVESALQAPFHVDGHEIHVGVSIGIAFAEEHHDPIAILRDADTAMYEAKSAGRGHWVVFDERLRNRAVERQRTETALRRSLNGEDLELRYQPILDLRTRAVRGAEALLRWRRDDGLAGPEEFISVAEETGLIVPIGSWVLDSACRQAAQWQRLIGWSDFGISVNVSARQLQQPGFVATVEEVLAATGVAEGTVTLEITETVLLDDVNALEAVMAHLRKLGVRVAIDDFGTGYSSLTYLHSLPVDAVKLDRSFVAGVADDLHKRAIVTAVLSLAKALGLHTVAEGIETERQLAELRMLGCASGQGHLIAEAATADEISALLTDGDLR
jgi:diguanylate cyclase (GGDEF)-like protein/PAS domain S-box-containing protein